MRHWFALAFGLLLPAATGILAYQALPPQSKLTAAEEKDSYEIYSMLLRKEAGPGWKTATFTITQETQTFPHFGAPGVDNARECLNVSPGQESIYLPLVDAYTARNKTKPVLERKFDLPQYSLVAFGAAIPAVFFMIFDVSAVGFNIDRTRALVYVGHHCGSLCGGGGYHLLVKKDGKWEADQEYRGVSCLWAS